MPTTWARCRYCGGNVNLYEPYHSDEEGFWHYGHCPKMNNMETVAVAISRLMRAFIVCLQRNL